MVDVTAPTYTRRALIDPRCRKCGHTPGWHTATACVIEAGNSMRLRCDCDGWERDPLDPTSHRPDGEASRG